MGKKRGFGTVRQLPSKRWQARYRGPDGILRSAPRTFATKKAAEQWLSVTEVQLIQGDWVDPERARITVEEYVARWIDQRPGLRPRTAALYKWLLRKHIEPTMVGKMQVGVLAGSPGAVRQWRSELLAAHVSESVAAKTYRLLRAAMNTAVEDRIIARNPCRVRGADRENPAERPTATVAQVFQLADAVPARYRALILLAAFCSLRWGEGTALLRKDLAEDASSVRISKALNEITGRGLVVSAPKSRAGVRTVTIPEAIRPDILRHLDEFVAGRPGSYVFTGDKGNPIRRPNFNQRVNWTKTVADMGLPGFHFHDLRHAGNVWASKAKISTKDLMARMGHDDMRAALIYQRATADADRHLANELSKMVHEHRGDDADEQDSVS